MSKYKVVMLIYLYAHPRYPLMVQYTNDWNHLRTNSPTWIPNQAHGDTFATHIYMPHENGSALMDLFDKHTMSNTYAVDLV